MRKFIAVLVCFAGILSVIKADDTKADVRKAAISKAMETFAGSWEIVTVKPDGATKEAKRLVFNKDGTYAAMDKDGKELWAGTFEIDPTMTPKIWDHRSDDGKKQGVDVLGIYALDGDTLKVACVVGEWEGKEWKGKPRPTGLDSKDVNVVIELKRAKSSK